MIDNSETSLRFSPMMDSLELWIIELREHVIREEPSLLEIFDIYAGEARFGRWFIKNELECLPNGSYVLEIGAGSLILSCQLAREGYAVTALEPIGDGFSHFSRLRSLVLDKASQSGHVPRQVSLPAEQLVDRCQYDFAFSINVMEHVENIGQVLRRVADALRPGGLYRFTCPNYLFPYEPHFNIPTLFSKRLTECCFRQGIHNNRNIPDPSGTWRSLNWITVPAILAVVRNLPGGKVSFRRDLLATMIARAVHDPIFSARRSLWLRKILGIVVKLGLHRLTVVIPARLQPVIDCTLMRESSYSEGF